MDEVKKKGGAREGAGRKPFKVARNKFITYVTNEEQVAIQNLVKEMRNEKSTQNSTRIEEQIIIDFDTQESNDQIELNALKTKHEEEVNNLKNEINKMKSEREEIRSKFSDVLKKNHNGFLELSESIGKVGQEIVDAPTKKIRVEIYKKDVEPLSARLIKLGINLQNSLSRLP